MANDLDQIEQRLDEDEAFGSCERGDVISDLIAEIRELRAQCHRDS